MFDNSVFELHTPPALRPGAFVCHLLDNNLLDDHLLRSPMTTMVSL